MATKMTFDEHYSVHCDDCDVDLPLQVLLSNAGYYLGHRCQVCGPYDRLSGYYPNGDSAKKALEAFRKEFEEASDPQEGGELCPR